MTPVIRYGLALITLAAMLGGPASACTAPTEFPYDPTKYPSDAVIEGTVTSVEQSDRRPSANLSVSQVYLGSYPAKTYRLEWWVYDGSGMCEPPGPAVKVGQRVRIYLWKSDGKLKAQGWVLANEYPKSKDQIDADQTMAKERGARQEKYFQAGGALSFNDPKEWLKISDVPELQRSKFPIYVSFTVAPDGTMAECESGHVEPHQALDLKACTFIKQRAHLVPPKFPEEAYGSFDMYPPGPASLETEVALPDGRKSPRQGQSLLVVVAIVATAIGGLLWWWKRPKA